MALCMLEGAGNRTYDLTHNGNDGVLTNGPLWKPGRNGTAIEFDGVNDYVDCGNGPSLQITDAITIEAWATIADSTAILHVVDKLAVPLGYNVYFLSGKTGKVRWLNFSGGAHYIDTNTASWTVGWRYHLVATYDGSRQKIYVGGILDKEGNEDAYKLGVASTNLRIGTNNGNGLPFSGLISDVRIWNRALSAQEVQDLYINPYGFIYKPQKYWLMPQGVTIPPHLFRRVA